MEYANECDVVAALKAVATALEESNRIIAHWIVTQTRWHTEEQARWQQWREEDLERIERQERVAAEIRALDIQRVLDASWMTPDTRDALKAKEE